MGFFRITGESERPVDEEPMSDCCSAPFTYPGFPDSDICSKCKEHAENVYAQIIAEEDIGESYGTKAIIQERIHTPRQHIL